MRESVSKVTCVRFLHSILIKNEEISGASIKCFISTEAVKLSLLTGKEFSNTVSMKDALSENYEVRRLSTNERLKWVVSLSLRITMENRK